MDTVPAARSRLGAVGHRPSRGARRAGEEQPEGASFDVGEGRSGAREELEVEELGVEGDRLVDVVDHVADVDHLIGGHELTSSSSVIGPVGAARN